MAVTHLRRALVHHPGHIDLARRMAGKLARRARLTAPADWELVVTELANNLLDHAGGGVLFLGLDERNRGLTVISVDRGPGMLNVGGAMADGFSTRVRTHPSLGGGLGLGTVRRKSTAFELWSEPGAGTVAIATAGDLGETSFRALVMPARHRPFPSGRLVHLPSRAGNRFAWLEAPGTIWERKKALAEVGSLSLLDLAAELGLGSAEQAGWVAEMRRDGGFSVVGSTVAEVCVDGRGVPQAELVSDCSPKRWNELLLTSGRHQRGCTVSGSALKRSAIALWGAHDAHDVAIITSDRRPVVEPLATQEPS